jgi:hypothetical protein
MSHEFIQSSKIKFTSLSVDSRFADQNYGAIPDTTDFQIRLPETIKNVMRIRLSSIEIPPVEYTFSDDKGNCNGVLIDALGTKKFTIQSGNYTNDSLAAAVQAALGSSFTCVYNPVSQRIVITRSSGEFTLQLGSSDQSICSRKTHWGLGYYLGFRTPYTPVDVSGNPLAPVAMRTINSVSNISTGYAAPLVTPTAYYLLQLSCPDLLDSVRHRLPGNSEIPVFAKIILQDGGNGVDLDNNSNDVWKEYTFLAPTNISQLRIRLLDPFGVPVRLNTTDWSMTFELTEIVNSRTYETLNKTYSA